MNLKKRIYLSPLGFLISFIQNIFATFHRPFMVYGYYNYIQKLRMRKVRISSTVKIMSKDKLDINDNVWIWHHSIIDASNGVTIGKGCQIGAWVGVFTHSSHLSIRLMGDSYMDSDERIGYQSGSVVIGDYCFIAASSIILPGTTIGKGVVISAGSVVNKDIPNYSIVSGNPAKVIGSVLKMDREYYKNPIVQQNYFDPILLSQYIEEQENK